MLVGSFNIRWCSQYRQSHMAPKLGRSTKSWRANAILRYASRGESSSCCVSWRAIVCTAQRQRMICFWGVRCSMKLARQSLAEYISITNSCWSVLAENWALPGTSLASPTWKFGEYWHIPLHNADFQSIFARSASAVTPSKKVQLTLIGGPLRAFQCTSLRRLAVAGRPCHCS